MTEWEGEEGGVTGGDIMKWRERGTVVMGRPRRKEGKGMTEWEGEGVPRKVTVKEMADGRNE